MEDSNGLLPALLLILALYVGWNVWSDWRSPPAAKPPSLPCSQVMRNTSASYPICQ